MTAYKIILLEFEQTGCIFYLTRSDLSLGNFKTSILKRMLFLQKFKMILMYELVFLQIVHTFFIAIP